MPSLVVLGEGNWHVLARPGVLATATTSKVDTGAPNRGWIKFIPTLALMGEMEKKYKRLKTGGLRKCLHRAMKGETC
jgi:hypothetical protein